MKKSSAVLGFFNLVVIIFLLIGEVKCIIKAINCNWEPVGKAEIIYTGAALTGFGSIVGWIDIEDN
jgi:hypothetical protein